MTVIGLDLGGTKLAAALFDVQGNILHRMIIPLEDREGAAVGSLILEASKSLLNTSESMGFKPHAIGISVPGIAYVDKGEAWCPNIPGWESYPIVRQLQEGIANESVKILLESDRSCYILGETWQGATQGCKHAICLSIGTGIGAGIMINGEVLQGSANIAGAIGWMALDPPYKSKYDDCGCFEYHASGAGLAKVAKAYQMTGTRPVKNINAATVFKTFEAEDSIATRVINEAIQYWGMAAANLISLFNPEKIIFGGGVFGPGEKFLDKIIGEAEKWAQPISFQQVSIELSQLGGDAGLIGAGYLALRSFNPQSKDRG